MVPVVISRKIALPSTKSVSSKICVGAESNDFLAVSSSSVAIRPRPCRKIMRDRVFVVVEFGICPYEDSKYNKKSRMTEKWAKVRRKIIAKVKEQLRSSAS